MERKNFVLSLMRKVHEYDSFNGIPECDSLVPYAGAKQALVKLLFLDLISTPKAIETKNSDDLLALWSLSHMIDHMEHDYNAEILKKALNVIVKENGIRQDLLDIDLFQDMTQNCWGILNDILVNFSSRKILSANDYALCIADMIACPQSSKDTANTYQYYTNESLQHLTAGILNVKSNETFMDCCCGMYSSALYNDAAEYIGVEQDKEMAGIAAMILIMCKKKFNIKLANFVESKDENIADKILADISYGVTLPKMDEQPYGKNGEAYCIENVINALKDGGSATIVCSGSVLGKQDSSKKMREAITKDHLKAVIALPPMNNGAKSNTNLIVLQKNCHAKEIRFINASNLEIKNKNRLTLNEADITDIIGCLNGENTKYLFKDIPVEDILNSESISWTPNNYVKGENKDKGRSVEEIDKDLNESYKELKELFLD